MNSIVHARFARMIMLIAVLLCCLSTIQAQTTQFTYQGRLTDGGIPANGSYDLQVKLFDALTGGNQIGTMNPFNGIAVTGGVFTVTLDFGAAAFPGANRWAEISARPTGSGTFTTLTPRQPVTSTPYAIKSLNAGAADSLSVSCNACVNGSQIASLPANSGSYIQNSTTQQAGSNFNISGNGIIGGSVGIGTATISPATKFQLNGGKMGILSSDGGYGQLQIGNPTNGPTDEASLTFNTGLTAFGNPTAAANTWGIGAGAFGIGGGKLAIGYSTHSAPVDNFGAKLTIQNDGNVGIGTNTPTTKFQVNGDKMSILSTQGSYGQLQVGNPNNGATDEATISLNTGLTAFGNSPMAANSWGIGAGAFGLGGAKLALGYGTQGTNFGPKLTIQNDGNVGIGTTSPGFTLHLAKDVTYPGNVPNGSAQLSLSGRTSPSKRLNLGYDTTSGNGFGFIAAGNLGVTWTDLALQPSGGNVGIGTTTPESLLTLKAGSNTAAALEVNQGTIKVAGAGINTNTAVFVHRATAASIRQGFSTVIDHPMTNGDPNAILFVTYNRNPGGGAQLINIQPIGIVYDDAQWRITFENNSPIPVGAAFNVMVVKP